MDILDIVGPIMIGPSSSHTAGANRIGNMARLIFGREISRADICLYNSFSKTGKGHGTDRAIIAGIMGYSLDDPIIKDAYKVAEENGVLVSVDFCGENPKAHPNLAEMILWSGDRSMKLKGISIGGGRVMISEIDGYKTEFYGDHHALMTIHKDVPGVVAMVSSIFALEDINIAYIRLYRNAPRHEELMIIETDDIIPSSVFDEVKKMSEIKSVSIIS